MEEKYTKGPFYLWSPMRNGGETMDVPTPTGGTRRVVQSRNVLPVGKKVTQSELSASDEQWQEWVDGGSIRAYAFPDMPAGSTDSPLVHLQKQINAVAQSEEERLVAAVSGITSSDEALAASAAEATKEQNKEEAKK